MTSFRDIPTTNLFAATIFRKQEVDHVEKIIPDPFIYWIAVINIQDDRDLARNPRRRIKVDLQHFKLYFVTRKISIHTSSKYGRSTIYTKEALEIKIGL